MPTLRTNPQDSPRVVISGWELALQTGFGTSFLRRHPAIPNTTADDAQISGDAIPISPPRDLNPPNAIVSARGIGPVGSALEITPPNRGRNNYRRIARGPGKAKLSRLEVIRQLAKVKTPIFRYRIDSEV